MRLTKAGGECGQSNSPSFKENHKQPAASSKMFFRELEYFFLLLSQSERCESPFIPIPDVKFVEEVLDIFEIERQCSLLLT